ncbi:hypothetical protein P154DRAFT_166444 [Amniculicola lignicola CBS 123094]|uniref:Uncharacterized protein n=1 Tax=Amniculicola lignicola CBS 123094 TaxID=1392246 RepID=A0A6A5WN53_9PLEO|nr:hypothetical protein P154DRAFT_166444 [Amniculicola lignicola CBS 123094]
MNYLCACPGVFMYKRKATCKQKVWIPSAPNLCSRDIQTNKSSVQTSHLALSH